jgi:hypothetical protein
MDRKGLVVVQGTCLGNSRLGIYTNPDVPCAMHVADNFDKQDGWKDTLENRDK